MRGSQTLFKNIFPEQQATLTEKRKGRSPHLHALRNECLIDRYFYYGKFSDKRYSVIIEILSREFFISQVTIPDLLDNSISSLAELKKRQPTKSYFTKKWPHLSW